jgi:hypothetical protein
MAKKKRRKRKKPRWERGQSIYTPPAQAETNGRLDGPLTFHFSPIQIKMLAVLADGLAHTRRELHACLYDELSNLSTIQRHLSVIRQKLRVIDQDIICELQFRRICYRHIRLLKSVKHLSTSLAEESKSEPSPD